MKEDGTFGKPPKLSMKWYYGDGEAICGSHLLYHKTAGAVLFQLSQRNSRYYSVTNCAAAGGAETSCGDILLSARLVSDSYMMACKIDL